MVTQIAQNLFCLIKKLEIFKEERGRLTVKPTSQNSGQWWFQEKWASFREGSLKFTLEWSSGRASGILYDRGVPLASDAFVRLLPLEIDMINVAWSGDMLMSTKTFDMSVQKIENQVRLVRPGDLTWDPDVGEICLVYGDAECRLPTGPHKLVVLGSVTEGLEQFADFGRARRFEGVGTVRISIERIQ